MASFPSLSSGFPVKYPLGRTVVCPTGVLRSMAGMEQRFKAAPAYHLLDLTLNHLSRADLDTIRTFFSDQKGAFGSAWDITIDGATYASCRFLDDVLTEREDGPGGRASVLLRIKSC